MKRFQRKLQLLLCHHPPDVKDLDPKERPVSAPTPTLQDQEQENGEVAAATLDSHSSPETQGDNTDDRGEAAKQQSPSETCGNGQVSDLAVTPTLHEHSSQENGETVQAAAATLDSHSSPETQGDNTDDCGEPAKQQSPPETCGNGQVSDLAVTPTLHEHSSQENGEVAAATLDSRSSPETQGDNTDEAAKQQSPQETCGNGRVLEKDSASTHMPQEHSPQEYSEVPQTAAATSTLDSHSSPETQGDNTDDRGESSATTEYEPVELQETSKDIAKQQSPPETFSNGGVSDFQEKDSAVTPTLQETQENSEVAAATLDNHSSPDLETQGDNTDDRGESSATTEYEPVELQKTSEDIAKPTETFSDGRVSDFQTVFEKEEVERKLDSNKVSLECLTGRNDSISGYIKVSNLAFQKTVAIRSTTDNWVTFKDTQAQYCESDHTTDRFSFELSGPFERGKLELAVCYTVNGLEWWDNNHGQNYVFVL